MAISHVNAATAAANQTTTCTITLTSFTTQANDILIVAFTNGGADTDPTSITGTTTTTGGLTFAKLDSLGGGATTDLNGSVWWARCSGNHSGQTIIGNGFTDSSAGAVGCVRGARTSGTPFGTASHVLNASGTNGLTGITTNSLGAWVLLTLHCDDNIGSASEAATDPATVTERADHTSAGGNDTAATICYEAQTTRGATGNFSWTNARGAGIYQIAIAAEILPQDQPFSATGVTVTLTPGTPALQQSITPTGATVSLTAGSGSVAAVGAEQHIVIGTTAVDDLLLTSSDSVLLTSGDRLTLTSSSTAPDPTVTVTPGTATVTIVTPISPTGTAVSLTPGTATVTPGAVSLAPTGTTVSLAAGTATVANQAPQMISPAGVSVSLTAGMPALALAVTPTGTTVTLTPGTGTVTPGAVTISPAGVTVTLTSGTADVAVGNAGTITPTGTTVSLTPGTATVANQAPQTISPAGVTVTLTAGTGTVTLGPAPQAISPSGATVSLTAGAPAFALALSPIGTTVALSPGTVALALALQLTGVTVTLTPGGPTFTFPGVDLDPITLTIRDRGHTASATQTLDPAASGREHDRDTGTQTLVPTAAGHDPYTSASLQEQH